MDSEKDNQTEDNVTQNIVQGFGAQWFASWDDATWKRLDAEFNALFKEKF